MTLGAMDRAMLELERLVEDAVEEIEADYARSGGHMPQVPNVGESGMRQQVGMWNHIIRQLGQWGIATRQSRWQKRRDLRGSTLRTEQTQVIGHRRWPRPPGREEQRGITSANHPDIQATDPRSGRRINIEVGTNEGELLAQLRRISQNDPQARVAAVLINADGKAERTWVYDPLSGRTTWHAGGLQRRDVLDFDE